MALSEEQIGEVVRVAVEDQLRQEAGYSNPSVSVDGRGRVEVRLPEKGETGTVLTVLDAHGEVLVKGSGEGTFWGYGAAEMNLSGQAFSALASQRSVYVRHKGNDQEVVLRSDGDFGLNSGGHGGRTLKASPGGDVMVSQTNRQVLLSEDGRVVVMGRGWPAKSIDTVLIQEADGSAHLVERSAIAEIEGSGALAKLRAGAAADPFQEGSLVEAVSDKGWLESTCVVRVGAKQPSGPTAKYARWAFTEVSVSATDPEVLRLGQVPVVAEEETPADQVVESELSEVVEELEDIFGDVGDEDPMPDVDLFGYEEVEAELARLRRG